MAASDESSAAELKKKALASLNAVAGQLNTLRSAENRARIGSNAAELLWDDDEKRSRALFAAVGEDIRLGFTDDNEDPQARNHTMMVFRQLRKDTIGRIAPHDPTLALEFLRATRPPAAAHLLNETEDSEKSSERFLELSLASQIAAKNPELGLKLGRESLSNGFSSDLLTVLSQLQLADKRAAFSFYKDIVDKLKVVNLTENYAATEVGLGLVQSFEPPEVDEQIYKDLIGILLASALANNCAQAASDDDPRFCSEVGSIFSKMEKYYGQRAVPLKRWASETVSVDNSRREMWAEVEQVSSKGSIDETLALAVRFPEMQYHLYWRAIEKAEASADFARARQIASDFPDASQRSDLIARVNTDEKESLIDTDSPAAIRRALSRFRSDEERLAYLVQTAGRIGEKDRTGALQLLNEASEIIDSKKPGKVQAQGQVVIALIYSSLKSDRGFAIMESLMPRLNELVSAAATLNGFENNYLSDGEWNMTGEGVLGELLTALANNSEYFARLDFARAMTLTNQLERPELRLMAQLKLAQSILSRKPNPALFDFSR